ncbi:RUN and SH3 domain-containing protein 1 [Alligator mississippiensis]|uniref:RUN and SH3 domain-containing protein 1 n=1 Tax=Alligator mississippiensis TaxID=8496 RepID=A0A151N640_ALLMI|nr:RUN and SH3 domain-containing protein 1 [Alligator mississippiensis]
MLSPKKGLLCNLNHIHLQHVSLGLHLSRHPELREGSVTMAPREQTGCSDCQENHGALEQVEQVDANSNNPSLQCRCCESHVPQPLKSGLRNQPALGDFLSLPMEENLASPSDAASSSSVSSCSDFSLDDTPVSVYCKEFPSDETQSPDLQPNIIPIEDARDAAPPTEQGTIMPEGRDSRLSPPEWEHLEALAQGSPDSLCSSSSLNSLSDTTSASVDMPETPGERPLPAVGGELDSNCNALPAMGSSPPGTCALAPGQLDLNLNRAPQPTPGPASGPPPVPPRPKRGLQILLSKMAMEKPAPAEAPAEPMGSLGEPPRDPARKNITSFHELAQKRKRNMAGPPLAQAKKDRSDWLIVFSPDTELPPPSELIACSAQGQELPRPQPQPGKQANPPSSSQREVTTFKELRYRNAINKQRGQLAWGEGAALQELPEPQQAAVGRALPSGEGLQGPSWAPALPLGSHSVAPAESYPPQRKKSRPGLQPIAEGLPGDAEDRGLPSGGCAPRRKQFWSDCEEEASGWRPRGPDGNPQELGRAERGDRTCKEVGSFLSRYPRPQTLPFQPLLFHFSADGKSLYCSSDPAVPPLPFLPSLNSSLESVELKSPVLFAAPFRPPLKTLSCDEACLLASRKGGALGALSPEELLPIRLSPVGAYSPPHRGGLPFLGSPDLSVLLSPFFPRSRTLPTMALPPHEASAPRVVEASVKPGPGTRSLQALYWHISRLAPLSSSRQRFHAFVLGLLNLKQLELWISWLQKSPGVISVLYLPSAFLALSQGPLPHLADELLLLIQPLSVLTFHLDLLFEHHHLSVDIRPLPDPAPGPTLVPASAAGPAETRGPLTQAQGAQAEGQGSTDRASPEHGAAPDGLGRAGLLGTEDSIRPQLTAAATSLFPSPRVGVSLQQTFQHVLQWGGRLSHVLTGADGPSRSPEHDQGPRGTRAGLGGWWGQLSQASAVYTASGKEDFPFTRWTALRTAPGDPSLTNTSCGAPAKGPSSTELQPLEARTGTNAMSQDSTSGARGLGLPVQATARESTGPGDPTLPEPAAGDRSQPVLEEPGWGKGAWLGRLFGATCPSARGLPMEPDTSSARPRRPSSWLRPRVSVLSLVRKGTAPEQPWPPEQQKEGPDSPQPHRAVRALCDHAGARHGYLSFRKGDVLQLMATVDEDWIRCCHKNDTGLVPVSYTSLIV